MKYLNIYHSLNCKTKYAIYLLEYSICKIQYVCKFEATLHIRLNNYRKDMKYPSAIPACKHFNSSYHDFNTPGKFTIMEQLKNITSLSNEISKRRLEKRENVWIKKLKIHASYGLIEDFN